MVAVATLVILVVGAVFGLIAYLIVGRRHVPVWAAVLIGMAAMLLGSLVANAFGVGDTQGIDWIELLIQFALAVFGVALVAGLRSRRHASGLSR